MNSNFISQNFLLINPNKIILSINEDFSFKELVKKEKIINSNSKFLQSEILNSFLDENILNIEQQIKNFIKKIYLIIDSEDFFSFQISIKKKNYGNILDEKKLIHVLNEVKNDCKRTLENRRLIHMTVENYYIDEKNYSDLPINMKCENFSLDIKLICISEDLIKDLERILKNYQISIEKIISASYVRRFFPQDEHNFFEMSKRIIDGYNKNEIQFVIKSPTNKGFFEKFFNLFS